MIYDYTFKKYGQLVNPVKEFAACFTFYIFIFFIINILENSTN